MTAPMMRCERGHITPLQPRRTCPAPCNLPARPYQLDESQGRAPRICWNCGRAEHNPAAVDCVNCGKNPDRPLASINFGPQGSVEIRPGEERMLGRDPRSCPDHEVFGAFFNVHRQHAVLRADLSGRVFITPIPGKANGTFVNDEEVKETTELRAAYLVRLARDIRGTVRIWPLQGPA